MSMNRKTLLVKSIRKALMGVVMVASIVGGASDCSAHFPYRGWGWGRGWHGVSYYSSFTSYRSFYYPRQYAHYYRPMVIRPSFVNPWCYAPIHYYTPQVYVAPIYNVPVYHVPVYRAPICPPAVQSFHIGYQPFCQSSPSYGNSTFASTSRIYAQSWNKPQIALQRSATTQPTRMAVENWLDARDEYADDAFESTDFQSVRPPMQLVSTQIELSEVRSQPKSIVVSKPAIKSLTPNSLVWSDSATGLVDEMVLSGDMRSALRSCDAMANNRQPMSKGVYLRHAILKLFTPDTETDVEKVLDLLNMSAAAGCELSPSDLAVSTLRDYLEPSRISLQESLNQFSQNALKSKTDGAADVLIIATLLKLDGQTERAKLFASEAFEKAAASDNFVWHSLLAAINK